MAKPPRPTLLGREESDTRSGRTNGGRSRPPLLELLSDRPGAIVALLLALTILALLYTLYFARVIVLPVVVATLLSGLLQPLVEWMHRVFVPRAVGAALVILALVGVVAVGTYYLSEPAATWIARAPSIMSEAEAKLEPLKVSFARIAQLTEGFESLTDVGDSGKPKVEVEGRGLGTRLFTVTIDVVVGIAVTLILLYFLLAAGDRLLRKIVRMLRTFSSKRRAVQIVRRIRRQVSKYLLTVTLINMTLGVTSAIVLYLLRMPNPLLWGALLGMLNFMPYLGPMIGVSIIGLVALVTLQTLAQAVVVTGAAATMTALEGSLITPAILGRRLALNPVSIIIGLLMFTWMWGVPGALLTVPLLMTVKIVFDHLEPLRPVGEIIGR